MNVFGRLRRWFSGPPSEPDAQATAERLHDRKVTIRVSQTSGGTPFLSGSGATNPPPTPDVLEPGDKRR